MSSREPNPTFILGGYQSDFSKKWRDQGVEAIPNMIREGALGALESAGIPAADVGSVHVGNLAAELFTGQAHLGAYVPDVDPAWRSIPASRHEAACASGSIAALAAMAEIEAGRYDVTLVIGVELMRNVPGDVAAQHLGCAARIGAETDDGRLPWPGLFSDIAEEVDRRYGLDPQYLHEISRINRANARHNPLAQTRDWHSADLDVVYDSDDNPIISGRMRRTDCGLITDGVAAVVLASQRYLDQRGVSPANVARIDGWGHQTASVGLREKLRAHQGSDYLFPNVRQAIVSAYERAGISGPDEVDAIETHDCFSITEYAVLDHFGLTAPGESWKAIADGTITMSGSTPVNPSGGLLGLGHPVGATGVRMLNSAREQVLGKAGGTQVDGARRVATLNIGGSASTAVSFVVGCGRD